MDSSVLLAIGGGAVAVLFAVVLTVVVLRQPPGNARMVEIASHIQEGASAYLNRQYTVIAVIGVVIAAVIGLTLGPVTAVLYLVGAACSASPSRTSSRTTWTPSSGWASGPHWCRSSPASAAESTPMPPTSAQTW